jgi:riboflavin biosynthesis pyrimidine reductase
MGKVILDMAMSLDGYIASKAGAYIYPVEDIKKTKDLSSL